MSKVIIVRSVGKIEGLRAMVGYVGCGAGGGLHCIFAHEDRKSLSGRRPK